MADAVNKIRTDYTAKKQSGVRPLSSIRYFVIHTAEAALPSAAAEAVGRYFAGNNAGGSTQFGVDIDSTQRYLGDHIIAWGAPPLNETGLHVECAGRAAFDRDKWLKEYAPMFKRLGWLLENRCRKYGIPLEIRDAAYLKTHGTTPNAGKGGITTHVAVSQAFRKSTHTDPGDGFPLDVVMAWVHKYSEGRIKGHITKPVIHLYCKGAAVALAQKHLTRHACYAGKVDGNFGAATEKAVKKFQTKHGIPANGVVGMRTWKALVK